MEGGREGEGGEEGGDTQSNVSIHRSSDHGTPFLVQGICTCTTPDKDSSILSAKSVCIASMYMYYHIKIHGSTLEVRRVQYDL